MNIENILIYGALTIYIINLIPISPVLITTTFAHVQIGKLLPLLVQNANNKKFSKRVLFTSITVFLLLIWNILVVMSLFYLGDKFPNWILTHTNNKIILFLTFNFFLLSSIWGFLSLYVAFQMSMDHTRRINRIMNSFVKDNKSSNLLMAIKIARWIEIKWGHAPTNIEVILMKLDIVDSWFIASNYQISLNSNIIKIRDESRNIEAFESYKDFINYKFI